jgi:hypothetical protein
MTRSLKEERPLLQRAATGMIAGTIGRAAVNARVARTLRETTVMFAAPFAAS